MLTRNLLFRVMTGVPLAVLAILYIFIIPELAFILIAFIIIVISVWEYSRALVGRSIPLKPAFMYFTALLFFLSLLLFWKGYPDPGLIALGCTLLSILWFSFYRQSSGRQLLVWYTLPLVWIIIPVIFLILIRFSVTSMSGSALILFIIVVAAFNDIAAYFGGKRFGRHLLAPTISPKKTIEGSLFGMVGGLVCGLLYRHFFLPPFVSEWQLVIMIIIMAAASQLGDLFESKFKRFCNIKDSSSLLPGHGGLLDRIDGYLFAIPVFAGMVYFFDIQLA